MPSLFSTDYLERLCRDNGLAPSKQYGQNYLIDEAIIERIMVAAALTKDDYVIEVGPGFGVLTERLANAARAVTSFEIEKKLQRYWEKKLKTLPNVTIEWGNVLRQFPVFNTQFSKYKVVANLPFQITSPVIRLFLESIKPPTELILMVQKEVAERICAAPGDMSLLAVSVQYYAKAEILFPVPRTAFWPSPQVDSAVIRLTPTVPLLPAVETKQLFTLVKVGFSNRRKFLIKNVLPLIGKKNKEKVAAIFALLGLNPTVRAQELSIENWIRLQREFTHLG